MTGVGLRLQDGFVNIGGSVADAVEGVFNDDNAEFVPRPTSVDDAILFDLAMGLGRLRCSNLKTYCSTAPPPPPLPLRRASPTYPPCYAAAPHPRPHHATPPHGAPFHAGIHGIDGVPAVARGTPNEILALIAGRVATTLTRPMEDLRSLRATCKAMDRPCGNRDVGRRLALHQVRVKQMQEEDPAGYDVFLRSLAAYGNLEACFLTGMDDIFGRNHSPRPPLE
ncbi:hypothetical protein HU200_002450 [Digitaria exilis]|uniref:Uncharacterized protein n=1 Tax=Digitaria exilis TaxID=1010633 RepID=A0A835FVN5_9POAL|nr:hypothetical protein HU200_002450 [Digitaria exilis]